MGAVACECRGGGVDANETRFACCGALTAGVDLGLGCRPASDDERFGDQKSAVLLGTVLLVVEAVDVGWARCGGEAALETDDEVTWFADVALGGGVALADDEAVLAVVDVALLDVSVLLLVERVALLVKSVALLVVKDVRWLIAAFEGAVLVRVRARCVE